MCRHHHTQEPVAPSFRFQDRPLLTFELHLSFLFNRRNFSKVLIWTTFAKMGDSQLYSESFTLTEINAQKYDRVSRLKGNTDSGDTELTLDVNTELYPCSVGERISIVIASTLSLDGTKDDSKGWRGVGRGEQTLADDFDYVCHGKVYRFEEGDDENIKVYVSFGGLLLYMQGPYRKLTPLRIDYVYLLVKK